MTAVFQNLGTQMDLVLLKLMRVLTQIQPLCIRSYKTTGVDEPVCMHLQSRNAGQIP